jgi:hypothetical protein
MPFYTRTCESCGQEYEDCACADGLDTDEDLDEEQRAAAGTVACDGTCVPACAWCMAAHDCPAECGGGGGCPYAALEASAEDVQLRQEGEALATALELGKPFKSDTKQVVRTLNVAAAVSRRRSRTRKGATR